MCNSLRLTTRNSYIYNTQVRSIETVHLMFNINCMDKYVHAYVIHKWDALKQFTKCLMIFVGINMADIDVLPFACFIL